MTRELAPEPLRTVQRFVNSIDIESGNEQLSSPEALRAFLVETGVLGKAARATAADLARAIEVREGLRAMLVANDADDEADPDVVAALNRAAARAHLELRFTAGSTAALEPRTEGEVDASIGRILAIAFAAMADGTWERLRACKADACRWAFYDHSRNRSGRWCAMSVCGNRQKVRAHRQRAKGA